MYTCTWYACSLNSFQVSLHVLFKSLLNNFLKEFITEKKSVTQRAIPLRFFTKGLRSWKNRNNFSKNERLYDAYIINKVSFHPNRRGYDFLLNESLKVKYPTKSKFLHTTRLEGDDVIGFLGRSVENFFCFHEIFLKENEIQSMLILSLYHLPSSAENRNKSVCHKCVLSSSAANRNKNSITWSFIWQRTKKYVVSIEF